MDTMLALMMGEINRGKEAMVFDWAKAANIIKDLGVKEASAGLSGDWEWTGGSILSEGKPIPKESTYTFLASTWATPELMVDGEVIDCYRMKSETPGWDSDTYWPKEALDIIK